MKHKLASDLLARCVERGIKIATAESCTGGMIAAVLTDLAGSSAVFDRGFVTYSNEAKIDMLGVRRETIEAFGAVSAETAAEMASGALARSSATLAIAVTGIAGPGGGSPSKPVGLVWFGLALSGRRVETFSKHFEQGTRSEIREAATAFALQRMFESLG